MQILWHHVVCGNLFDAVLKSSKAPALKKLQWLQRAVLKSNFMYQVEYISQKIRVRWRHLAEVGAAWVCAKFKGEKCQVLISADETFIRFYKTRQSCAGLKG